MERSSFDPSEEARVAAILVELDPETHPLTETFRQKIANASIPREMWGAFVAYTREGMRQGLLRVSDRRLTLVDSPEPGERRTEAELRWEAAVPLEDRSLDDLAEDFEAVRGMLVDMARERLVPGTMEDELARMQAAERALRQLVDRRRGEG